MPLVHGLKGRAREERHAVGGQEEEATGSRYWLKGDERPRTGLVYAYAISLRTGVASLPARCRR